jgi:hypothetical protein
MRLDDCRVDEEAESMLFIPESPHTLQWIFSSSPTPTRYSRYGATSFPAVFVDQHPDPLRFSVLWFMIKGAFF